MAEKKRLEILRRAHLEGYTGLAGLTLAFVGKYGDEAWEVFRDFMKMAGQMQGEAFKEKAGIKVKGPADVKRLLETSVKEFFPYVSWSLRVEGNKVIAVTDSTTCVMPEVAKALGLPLRTLCENWMPSYDAMLRTVAPNIKHTSKEISEKRCVEEFEVV